MIYKIVSALSQIYCSQSQNTKISMVCFIEKYLILRSFDLAFMHQNETHLSPGIQRVLLLIGQRHMDYDVVVTRAMDAGSGSASNHVGLFKLKSCFDIETTPSRIPLPFKST